MRVFYVDEDVPQPPRQYYVKIDNIAIQDELKGFKVIKASTAAELKDRIYEVYNFKENAKKYIQLWSGPLGMTNRIRLDTLITIPSNCEEIYVRGIANNTI